MNSPDTVNTVINTANIAANNAADALQQLRDIHLPESSGWWPPAPGWWLLAAVGLACLVLAVRGWQGWQRRNRRWQAVQRELTALRAQSQTQSQNSPGWFSQLNALLKRAARDSYPLQPVAAMSGSDWVAFLQKTFLQKNSNNAVDAELVNSLVNACWQPHSSCDPQQALAFAGRWLQDHKKQLRGAP
jgi:type II secretory pathway pseudopilin PulG